MSILNPLKLDHTYRLRNGQEVTLRLSGEDHGSFSDGNVMTRVWFSDGSTSGLRWQDDGRVITGGPFDATDAKSSNDIVWEVIDGVDTKLIEDEIREVASDVTERVKQISETISDKAKDAGHKITDTVDDTIGVIKDKTFSNAALSASDIGIGYYRNGKGELISLNHKVEEGTLAYRAGYRFIDQHGVTYLEDGRVGKLKVYQRLNLVSKVDAASVSQTESMEVGHDENAQTIKHIRAKRRWQKIKQYGTPMAVGAAIAASILKIVA